MLFSNFLLHIFFVIKFKIWYSFVVVVHQSILVLKHNSMPFLLIFISFLILSILINKCLRWYITVRQLFYCVRFQQIYVFDLKWNRRVCMCSHILMLFQFWMIMNYELSVTTFWFTSRNNCTKVCMAIIIRKKQDNNPNCDSTLSLRSTYALVSSIQL